MRCIEWVLALTYCKTLNDRVTKVKATHPKHTKLITAIRTALENGEGLLDKDATSHDDLFDAFRMSLMFWH